MVQIISPTAFLAGANVAKPAMSPLQAMATAQQMKSRQAADQRAADRHPGDLVAQDQNSQIRERKIQDFDQKTQIEERDTKLAQAALEVHAGVSMPDDKQQPVFAQAARTAVGTSLEKPFNDLAQMPPGEERDKFAIELLAILKSAGKYGTKAAQAGKQKTGTYLARDADGNPRLVTGVFDTQKGTLGLESAALPEGWQLISKEGETPDETTGRKIDEAAGKKVAEETIKKQTKVIDQYEVAIQSIATFDEAVSEVENAIAKGEWLGVGPLQKYVPKWTEGAARLDNIANRLGLDVVSAVTFGALSEKELQMAKDTALPQNLPPKELLQWLRDRRAAKQKLADYLKDAATFIGAPKADGKGIQTSQDWMNYQKKLLEKRKEMTQEVKIDIAPGEAVARDTAGNRYVERGGVWKNVDTGEEYKE